MLDDHDLFTVTDLKQWAYCPRVVFYERCLPHIRPRTFKMEMGKEAHEAESKRALRRDLTRFEAGGADRAFDVVVKSPQLGLVGMIDETVRTPSGECFPIDYKLAKKVSPNHRVQLAAYAMMLEEAWGQPINRGFIYLIPLRKMIEVPLDEALRNSLLQQLQTMHTMITQERMPLPTKHPEMCLGCEFRRFCNDV